MNNILAKYELLFKQFLDSVISVEDFQKTYLELFKNEMQLEESLFKLLDELFGDVDSFTTDQELLTENPEFYLDEAKLRAKVEGVVNRLSAFGKKPLSKV